MKTIIRNIAAATAFVLGLLFASGKDENILQAAIALALIIAAAALFGAKTSSTTHFHHIQNDEPRQNAEYLTTQKRKEETL